MPVIRLGWLALTHQYIREDVPVLDISFTLFGGGVESFCPCS